MSDGIDSSLPWGFSHRKGIQQHKERSLCVRRVSQPAEGPLRPLPARNLSSGLLGDCLSEGDHRGLAPFFTTLVSLAKSESGSCRVNISDAVSKPGATCAAMT
jgi:hypothetical protein